MIATTYQTADAFLQTTQAYLEEDEATNSLMLGICFQIKRFPDRVKTSPYFITVTDEDELVLAGVMTPPHNLVMYSRDDRNQILEVFAQKLLDDMVIPPGVLGPARMVKAFAATWAEATGVRYRAGMRQRIYQLRRVIPPQYSPSGQMRLAREDEVDLITEWALAFQEEALGPGDPEQTQETVAHRINKQEIYVWEDDLPVSIAAKARPIVNGISVNLVYTPPEFRRRGYATACVASLSQYLLDSGWKFCVLFTDLSNPTSNHIYQSIGYTSVCDFNEYIFDVEADKS